MGNAPSKAPTSQSSSSSATIDEKRAYYASSSSSSDVSIDMKTQKPLSADGSLSAEHIATWEKAASADPTLLLSRTILSHTDFRSALLSRKTAIADRHLFNTKLDYEKNRKVTNQKRSGRCWLFATTNVIRYNIAKNLGLQDFELSQSYLFFWDKLEKANYYLELTIEHADLPLDDRLIVHLASDPINDGGQWDMSVNLLQKYGVVPQSVFPESYSSSDSGRLDQLVTAKLREYALNLRALSSSLRSLAHLSEEKIVATLRAKKEEFVEEVYKILSVTLGEPPKAGEAFTWEYENTKGQYQEWKGTGSEFYKTFGPKQYIQHESFSLINDPRNEYSKLYTVEKLGNIWGGLPIRYVNTTSERLQQAVVKAIKAGQPVFFGCDVGKSSDNATGIMDTQLYNYESAFGVKLDMNKAERLRTGESAMTHAMTITAVHLDKDGKPVRFRVENSWGETAGDNGYMVMTSDWFDEYVYQVVIPRALAPADLVKVLDGGDAIALPPWDPLGSLA